MKYIIRNKLLKEKLEFTTNLYVRLSSRVHLIYMIVDDDGVMNLYVENNPEYLGTSDLFFLFDICYKNGILRLNKMKSRRKPKKSYITDCMTPKNVRKQEDWYESIGLGPRTDKTLTKKQLRLLEEQSEMDEQ